MIISDVFSEEPIIEKLLVSEKVEIDVVSFPFGDPLYHLTDDSFDTFAQLNGPVTLNLKAGVSARVTEVNTVNYKVQVVFSKCCQV